MVQRKVPSKLGILHHHLKADTLRPSSPQTQIMKKSRSIKRPDESRSSKKSRSQPSVEDGSPNYMKSTSSFEARKEHPKAEKKPKTQSLKVVTKTPSFKHLKKSTSSSSSSVINIDVQRATCSSTLKDSKFSISGGTGTSVTKVCPYSYCSLNGHHRPPAPPLRCFLSARRRALKTQKGFKLTNKTKEENKDLFIEIYSPDLGNSDLCGKIQKMGSYDEQSVISGDWSESESDSSYQQAKINNQTEAQDFEVSSEATKPDLKDEIHEDKITRIIKGKKEENENISIGDHDKQEKACQESESIPDFTEKSRDSPEMHHTTVIYNIVNLNISIFINGEKTEDSGVTVETTVADNKMKINKDDANNLTTLDEARDVKHIFTNEEVSQLNAEIDNKDSKSLETNSCFSDEKQSDSAINLRESSRMKKELEEDSREFNPREPNFLPEVVGPDAETVDLKHQIVDERKNAEEWMVDFALQQALAPARKRKVALLVQAFEKVKYDTRNNYAFTNARPMQACN